MKNSFLLITVLSLPFAGCVQETPEEPAGSGKSQAAGGATSKPSGSGAGAAAGTTSKPTKVAATARLDETVYKHFGDGVAAAGETMSVAALAAKADALDGKKVRLTGDVDAVCAKKGCWMVLAEGDKKVRVKFRDYGFFVPKDCKGQSAVLEGTFKVATTSVAELKHLLEDEGKKEEAAKVTEPRVELSVMADGVALKKK